MSLPIDRNPEAALLRGQSKAGMVLTALIFILVLAGPGAAKLIGWAPASGNYEKRFLAELPRFELAGGKWADFPKKYDRYFNDNFGLRIPMVRMYSNLRYRVFGAREMNNVLIGRDGWLYYATKTDGDPVECYRGVNLMSDKELARAAACLDSWREWLANRGIEFAVLLAPNKSSIFEEHLPQNLRKVSETSRLDQLNAYLKKNTRVNFINARPILSGKKDEHVFYHTDTHWTLLGAFYAYEKLMDSLSGDYLSGKPFKRIGDYRISFADRSGGDLAHMLIIDDFLKDKEIWLNPEKTKDKNAPRLLLFGDSFAAGLMPFLEQHFQLSFHHIVGRMKAEYIDQDKPDLVVLEMVERYVGMIPKWVGYAPGGGEVSSKP